MRDSDWGTIIPSLAHCYFSELFCRALFVQKQYKHMFNLYRSSILNINVGGDSAWTTSIIFSLIRGLHE